MSADSEGRATREALDQLGVGHLLLAIHDASFPSDPDEDVGAGAPGTRAAHRLLGFVRALGFTGLQLGPQGETSRGNASPYDGTIFSRAISSIPSTLFVGGGPFEGLVSADVLAAMPEITSETSDHARAHDTTHQLVELAWSAFANGARPDLAARLHDFRRAQAWWLDRDALFSALAGGDPVDATLWLDDEPARVARRGELAVRHARAIDAYAFAQLIAHDAHALVRERARVVGLALYGDLQVGVSVSDAWCYANAFLADYVMGAPPSRTNREGQPWNYPVLDPERLHAGGAAFALVRARFDKAFAEYDSLRIDHPHGLVCPWVYRRDVDPAVAVRDGARLYASPDLDDHPDLARYARVTAAQLDRSLPRHADHWVRELRPAQIDRYAVLFDELVASARRHGRSSDAISCEVLSTLPAPLARVLERHDLGRWRVMQKAKLDDPDDVYRVENAAPADWVMLGNHDTPSIFGLIGSWDAATCARWASYLGARLSLPHAATAALAEGRGLLVAAMFAVLFASRARNVMVFFADLFGHEERFNVPGTISDTNWALRLPPTFAELYRDRLAQGRALNVPLACALALRARGLGDSPLSARLWELAAASTPLPAAVGPG